MRALTGPRSDAGRRRPGWPILSRRKRPMSAAAASRYQCTPFITLARATCSIDACSVGSLWPLAAAESGKTL